MIYELPLSLINAGHDEYFVNLCIPFGVPIYFAGNVCIDHFLLVSRLRDCGRRVQLVHSSTRRLVSTVDCRFKACFHFSFSCRRKIRQRFSWIRDRWIASCKVWCFFLKLFRGRCRAIDQMWGSPSSWVVANKALVFEGQTHGSTEQVPFFILVEALSIAEFVRGLVFVLVATAAVIAVHWEQI